MIAASLAVFAVALASLAEGPDPIPLNAPQVAGPDSHRAHVAVISRPDWAGVPHPDELNALYPRAARAQGIGGMATLRCNVNGEGVLKGCTVLREAPLGYGFGDAALAAARYFRMRSITRDGASVVGGVVIVPLRFGAGD